MHTAAAVAFFASLLALSLGVVGLIRWVVRRRASRADSAYRAACMIAEARGYVLRTTCRLVRHG